MVVFAIGLTAYRPRPQGGVQIVTAAAVLAAANAYEAEGRAMALARETWRDPTWQYGIAVCELPTAGDLP